MRTIFTIGYEGAELGAFLSTLALAGVEHVVDIRDVPVSRKKGFSKTSLALHLESAGIQYTHVKPLGDPKEGREAMRRGDTAEFQRIFGKHLLTAEAEAALNEVSRTVTKSNVALLCYERDPKYCHRSIVAKQVAGIANVEKVTHLGVNPR